MIPSSTTYLVVDVETTGFDPATDKVVEIGALWLDSAGIVLDRYESLVNPGREIPPESSAVHHILDEDVIGSPPLDDCLAGIHSRAPYDVLVGHNFVDFDSKFVEPLVTVPMLDTMRLAQRLWPDLGSHKNMSLAYGLKLVGGPRASRMAHSALFDCVATGRILMALLGDLEAKGKEPDIAKLGAWQMMPRLLRKVGFGKHAGTLWKDVPMDYLQWIVNKSGMTDPDILHTARTILGK
jgi:exodeoxyribonuclease X